MRKLTCAGPEAVDRAWRAGMADVPTGETVAQWCARSLRFDESSNHGPFELAGHEYIADVLEDFARTDVQDEVLVWGSQTRKTGTLMGGVAWCILHDPCGFLWVMPSLGLARRFSRQRFARMLRRSEPTAALIPHGAGRHEFSMLEMVLQASTINFVGSNSPANLSSNPCRRIVLDEVDKFDTGGAGEADAVSLAEQRTKDQPSPQRWKTSTPTTAEGLIWREFELGDQRRYLLPCPHCGGEMLLAWSKQYTVFPLRGDEGFVSWDQTAKRSDGSWDLDLVERSAHVVCPHCRGLIRDIQKPGMVARGRWQATASQSAAGFVSRHLSSLYAPGPETAWGRLAVKFLQSKATLAGIHAFVNGCLAEPFVRQDIGRERYELVTQRVPADASGAVKLLTVDCQHDCFWFVVRVWLAGDSEAIDAGRLTTWEEIEAKQAEHGIPNAGVLVDSGFGARSDKEVYSHCAQHAETAGSWRVGWLSTKGLPGRELWPGRHGGMVPWTETKDGVEPFWGTSLAGRFRIPLLRFSADWFKDVLSDLRRQKGPHKWSVRPEVATETYWKHLDGETLVLKTHHRGRARWTWELRHKRWPNHLLDCEVLQLLGAAYVGLFEMPDAVGMPGAAADRGR